MTRRRLPLRMTPGRGMAALTVVMILFFVMALVAAYTNRNLLFEQRISANSYRSNRALEAADAGVEWTVAMLNAGRIDANCNATANTAFGDFRSRYLVRSDNAVNVPGGEGGFNLPWGAVVANRVYPACIVRDGALRCVCPVPGAALPVIDAPADGIGSAFRIAFFLPAANTVRAGVIQFTSRGCSNPGSGDTACYAQNDSIPAVDGVSAALSTVGLVRALPVAPLAPLTTGGAVLAATGKLVLSNFDTQTDGLTVRAGGAIDAPTSEFSQLRAGVDTRRASVAELAALAGAANEGWFRAMFAMDSATYRQQPAVIRIDCAAGCNQAQLAAVLTAYPRNTIWLDGNLNLDAAGSIGNLANPVMLIITGTLTVSSAIDLVGFVHANRVDWTALGSLRGALVAATTFTATNEARLRYDKAVLDVVRLEYGSFVRAPGSWNLF